MNAQLSRRLFLLASALTPALAACDRAPPARPEFADIRFTQKPRFRLDVASVDVDHVFRPTLQAPQVEQLFPVPPEIACENWARDRLEAANVNAQRRCRVRILDANVKEVALKLTEGIRGAFTTDQSHRYDATVEMAVDIIPQGANFPERSVSAKASRSQSVAENITPYQREQAWYDLTRAVMAEIDDELERQIRANFLQYIIG
jgi:hypothetical protein